ncbi:MAG: hypothetical protein JW863_10730, partial [Chitinispirillaceae bacterium]|nr:hypothetical protein [Chitinispirillaceae bacterium]
MKKNRWYDKHESLANHLESLKKMPKRQLNEMLKDLITLARLLRPSLFEEHLLEYPLDLKKRRWYDDDPYLWLLINGLRFAEDDIILKVVAFFDKQVQWRLAALKKRIKKAAANKATVKKTATKKTATKKTATKKTATKKTATKKAATKKAATKKAATKKAATKKAATKK